MTDRTKAREKDLRTAIFVRALELERSCQDSVGFYRVSRVWYLQEATAPSRSFRWAMVVCYLANYVRQIQIDGNNH